MSAYTAWGLTLIAVAWLIILGTVAALFVQHVIQERGIQRAEDDWREWFDQLPEAQKMAGAQRLLDAVEGEYGPRAMWGPVSETPRPRKPHIRCGSIQCVQCNPGLADSYNAAVRDGRRTER